MSGFSKAQKERIQIFSGTVIARRGSGMHEMFTVRRIVQGEGVERIFPIHSPKIAKVEVKRTGRVRRAKLVLPARPRRQGDTSARTQGQGRRCPTARARRANAGGGKDRVGVRFPASRWVRPIGIAPDRAGGCKTLPRQRSPVQSAVVVSCFRHPLLEFTVVFIPFPPDSAALHPGLTSAARTADPCTIGVNRDNIHARIPRQETLVAARWFGNRSERAAALPQTPRGYRIVARNYQCQLGELDLVALDGVSSSSSRSARPAE